MGVWIKLILNGLWSSRLPLFVVALLVGVLSVGQGKELAQSLQGSLRYSSLLAILSVGGLVVPLWYWTYIAVLVAPISSHRIRIWSSVRLAERDPLLRTSAIYVASAYAGTVLLVVLYQFYQIGNAANAFLAGFTNVMLLIYVVSAASPHGDRRVSRSLMNSLFPDGVRRKLLQSRFRRLDSVTTIAAAVSLLASPLLYFVWIKLPEELAFPFGSFGSAFLSLAILTPWIFFVFVLCQGIRLPIATLVVVAPFLSQSIFAMIGLPTQQFRVRSLEGSVTTRPSLEKVVDRWRGEVSSENRPVVFVTAAGGGIRAAYWTAAVLGRLQDCIQDFHTSVFSISSVSGGSLGAAAYVALLAGQKKSYVARSKCKPRILVEANAEPSGFHQQFLKSFLSHDYLAPVVREAVLGDIPRSFLPWSLSDSSMDRGIALEKAWEQAWFQACAAGTDCGTVSFGMAFTALSANSRRLPLLLLNGVHEETGKRIITSTGRVTTDYFPDATDFFDLVQHDVRISTAVLNSARFPIVSPSGALFRHSISRSSGKSDEHHVGHVIDGGYFDNNGTVTSQEVAAFTLKDLKADLPGGNCSPNGRKAIFIEIVNDTTMSELDSDRDNLDNDVSLSDRVGELSKLAPDVPFHSLIVAVNGLESSRAARAVHSSKMLARYARSVCGGQYFVMPLCKGIVPQPALGWTLSEGSRNAMDQLVLGGVDTRSYAGSTTGRDFFDCYNLIQSNLATISDLMK